MFRRFNRFNILTLLLFSSCVVGPKYKKPAFEAPSTYKTYTKTRWIPSQPKDDRIRGKWWELFEDKKLTGLEEQVNLSNQNIVIAFASFLQSRATIKEARAQYFPTLNFDPNAYQQGGHIVATSTNNAAVSGSGTFVQYSLPFDATWAPDLWGRIQSTVAQNTANAQVSAADLENQRLVQQADVAIAYYQLRGQDALKKLYEESIAAYQDSLKFAQSQYKTGINTDEAVAQAETQLKTTQALATNINLARAQYEHAIALLVGKPASEFSVAINPLLPTPPQIPTGVPSELLERRPDIAAAERGMAAANAQIGVGMAAYYPSLTINGTAGFQTNTYVGLLSLPSFFWSVGEAFSQNIFDGGLRRATVERYKAAYDLAVATYRQTVLTAFQQVEDSLAGVSILSKEISEQELAIQASDRYLRIATHRYKLGIDPYLNVLTAQISLLSNRQTLINLQTQHLVAAVQLIEAIGGGWEAKSLPSEEQMLADPPKTAQMF